jgi:hypothetical protein
MTDETLPDAQRCVQPGCDRPATDPKDPAGACPEHHPDENPNPSVDDEGYISDAGFPGDLESIRAHYERLSGVYEELGTLAGEYPTLGFAGNDGWYQYREIADIELLEAGWKQRGRCTNLSRDWRAIIDSQLGAEDRAREVFNIASWKDPEALRSWQPRRWDTDDSGWQKDTSPTPSYADMRGFGFWCDLDLADKAGRTDLSTRQRATVEHAQQVVIELVADLYGVSDNEIYALDSGGGSYIYGPPEAALPLAGYCSPEDRELLFNDIRERMRDGFAAGDLDGFEGVWPTVTERVDGADDLLDPDWIQNCNRQTKAPGALHHDHDLVVTPLRPRDEDGSVTGAPDYTPTRPTEIDEEAVAELEGWAAGLTSDVNRDAIGEFLRGLYPGLAGDASDWEDIADARLETLKQRKVSRRERDA